MLAALASIQVWEDSPVPLCVHVFQEGKLIDRVTVIPGDCLDLELEGRQLATSFPDLTPDEEDEA